MPIHADSDALRTSRFALGPRATSLALAVALWLLAPPAGAVTLTPFFGQDVPLVDGIPATHPASDVARAAFFAMLADRGTEDFESFQSEDEAPLDLSFRSPTDTEIETGTLYDGTGDGFVATAQIAKTGFPTSGEAYWKNTTPSDEDALFRVNFDHPVRAFGFYATAWETLSHPGETQLVLELKLSDGTTVPFVIPHDTASTITGKVFYVGVISDLSFVKATLRNTGDGDGDVIGFDDFTVAHTIIPEPGTGWLLAGGMLALAAARRHALHRSQRTRPGAPRPEGRPAA